MAETTMTRISEAQLAKLKAMADASRVSARDLLDRLIDQAYRKGTIVTVVNSGVDPLIDEEFSRRVNSFPTLAEVESREGAS